MPVIIIYLYLLWYLSRFTRTLYQGFSSQVAIVIHHFSSCVLNRSFYSDLPTFSFKK